MEPNRRLEYAYQKRYRGCGHTINIFGRWNERTDAQSRAGAQPLLYFEDKCEDCKARQNIGDSNINFLLTALRTQIDGYVKKMQDFSTENKQLKISISKKDVEIQKTREESAENRAAWRRILDCEFKQRGELRRLRQEKEDYEAEIVKLRKTVSQQGQELQILHNKVNDFEESPTENNLPVKNTNTPNLQALGPLPANPYGEQPDHTTHQPTRNRQRQETEAHRYYGLHQSHRLWFQYSKARAGRTRLVAIRQVAVV